MAGNPNHGKDGKFSSGPGGDDTGSGHNAGKGNREVAAHIKQQHNTHDAKRMNYSDGSLAVHPNFPSQVPRALPGSAGARQIALRMQRGY